jgi:hypothetical protein
MTVFLTAGHERRRGRRLGQEPHPALQQLRVYLVEHSRTRHVSARSLAADLLISIIEVLREFLDDSTLAHGRESQA